MFVELWTRLRAFVVSTESSDTCCEINNNKCNKNLNDSTYSEHIRTCCSFLPISFRLHTFPSFYHWSILSKCKPKVLLNKFLLDKKNRIEEMFLNFTVRTKAAVAFVFNIRNSIYTFELLTRSHHNNSKNYQSCQQLHFRFLNFIYFTTTELEMTVLRRLRWYLYETSYHFYEEKTKKNSKNQSLFYWFASLKNRFIQTWNR